LVEETIFVPFSHMSGSFCPTGSRFGRFGNEDTAWLGLKFDFIVKLGFLKQRLWKADTTGIADPNDVRFHVHLL
jgi:hypothetical protein